MRASVEPALEERVRDRLDQRLARREVPVDRADADAGAARDVLHAERRAVPRVLVDRGLEHALAVARRVDPLAAHRSVLPDREAGLGGRDRRRVDRERVELVALGRRRARLARDGTNAAATPAHASATPSTMNESS